MNGRNAYKCPKRIACGCVYLLDSRQEQLSTEYFVTYSSAALQSAIEKVAKCDSPWPIIFIAARPKGTETALGMLYGHYRCWWLFTAIERQHPCSWSLAICQDKSGVAATSSNPSRTEGIDVIGYIFFPLFGSFFLFRWPQNLDLLFCPSKEFISE